MALKRISLTPAERQALRLLVQSPKKADLESAQNVRELNRRLDLKQLGRLINKQAERARDFGFDVATWDDLLDWENYLDQAEEQIAERLEKEKDAKEIERLEKYRGHLRKVDFSEQSYTIDDSFLKWVQKAAGDKDWKKQKNLIQDPRTGQIIDQREIEVDVPTAQLEAFADLVDKINGAIAAASVTEENEAKKAKKEAKGGESED